MQIYMHIHICDSDVKCRRNESIYYHGSMVNVEQSLGLIIALRCNVTGLELLVTHCFWLITFLFPFRLICSAYHVTYHVSPDVPTRNGPLPGQQFSLRVFICYGTLSVRLSLNLCVTSR